MAGVFSRFIGNSKFSFIYFGRRFCSQAIIKPEIHSFNDEVHKLSTLFVPGRHGSDVYQIVKPLIDIDYIATNLGNLKLSCDHRGIDLNLDYVLQIAEEWLSVKTDYLTIMDKEQEYINELQQLNPSISQKDKAAMEDLDRKRKEHLDTIISGKKKLHDIEDIAMPLFQKLPHILHPNTPLQFSVIEVCREPPTLDLDVKSHTEIGRCQSLLHFGNNPSISYFMTDKLFKLDFALQEYFMEKFKNLDFFPLSCVDFCKSFIIEAIGYDPHSNLDSILIKSKGNREIGQKLHLVGGASFETFCAYFTNMNINQSTLPVKYFSLGRRYTAGNNYSNSLDLFSVVQSTNVHGLILSESAALNSFDILLQAIINCYIELNIPFRMVNIAAKNLTIAESQRKQLELWSPALRDYVPVAYVSQHDDFVSKRLQITYGIQHVKEGYCHIVEGVIVNIPVLIGCIVENFQTKDVNFDIPTVLEKYIS